MTRPKSKSSSWIVGLVVVSSCIISYQDQLWQISVIISCVWADSRHQSCVDRGSSTTLGKDARDVVVAVNCCLHCFEAELCIFFFFTYIMRYNKTTFEKLDFYLVSTRDDEEIMINSGSERVFHPGTFNTEHWLSPGAPGHCLVHCLFIFSF